MRRSVCVFCGSSPGNRPTYAAAAALLGQSLVSKDISVVYGGGKLGLMGVLAETVLKERGQIIGVMPKPLVAREHAHGGLTELRVVHSMHERKALMADLSDAFIALPGGYGTFEEFCEILTWTQLGLHQKPCGLLNVNGYYDDLLRMFDHAVAEGFVKDVHREMLISDVDSGALVDRLLRAEVPRVEKWIRREQT